MANGRGERERVCLWYVVTRVLCGHSRLTDKKERERESESRRIALRRTLHATDISVLSFECGSPNQTQSCTMVPLVFGCFFMGFKGVFLVKDINEDIYEMLGLFRCKVNFLKNRMDFMFARVIRSDERSPCL